MARNIPHLGRLALASALIALAASASLGTRTAAVALAYSGCVSTSEGSAVLYNPSFVVHGLVDATGCQNGIVYDGTHTGTINGATISGATTGSGGNGDGVYVSDSAVVKVIRSTIQNNAGNGIEAAGSSIVTSISNTVANNIAGLAAHDNAIAHVISGTYSSNSAGIDLYGSSVTDIAGTTVRGNCDGLLAHDSARFTLHGGIITNNGCDGVDLLDSVSGALVGTHVSQNLGGISLQSLSSCCPSINLNGTIVTSNTLFGIDDESGSVFLRGSVVCNNQLVNVQGSYTSDKASRVCT